MGIGWSLLAQILCMNENLLLVVQHDRESCVDENRHFLLCQSTARAMIKIINAYDVVRIVLDTRRYQKYYCEISTEEPYSELNTPCMQFSSNTYPCVLL